MEIDERISRYLDKCPPAISGSDGHGQTFTVACALVNGFALDAEAALRHLTVYNAKCVPPWSPRELRHKIVQAEKTAPSRPRGHLLGSSGNKSAEAVQCAPKPVPVRLTPKNRRFRTLRTLLFDPTDNVRARTHSILDSGNAPSEASESAEAVLPGTVGTSTGIPVDPLNWSAINAEFPPDDEEKDWHAVIDAGFGDEPLILAAFTMFGPGCQVLDESGEVRP